MVDLLRVLLSEPILEAEEERALARAARSGDGVAGGELVRRSLRLVALRVRALGVRGHDADDAFQAGVLALMAAAGRFDPDRGVRLATYAWPWITRAVRDVSTAAGVVDVRAEVPDAPSPSRPGGGVLEVESLLATLPPVLAEVVRIRHGLRGVTDPALSWPEVAERLGTSVGTARRRHDRAMAHLRLSLARVGDRAARRAADPP